MVSGAERERHTPTYASATCSPVPRPLRTATVSAMNPELRARLLETLTRPPAWEMASQRRASERATGAPSNDDRSAVRSRPSTVSRDARDDDSRETSTVSLTQPDPPRTSTVSQSAPSSTVASPISASTVSRTPTIAPAASTEPSPDQATVDIPPDVTTVSARTHAVELVEDCIRDRRRDETDDNELEAGEAYEVDLDSDPDTFPGRFHRLLHLSLARAQTPFNSGRLYAAPLIPVTSQALQAHFSGQIALGFTCLEDARGGCDALFGAIDVDEAFDRRLPVLAKALADVGGPELAAAAFATSGSGPGRGKLLITIERPTSAADVRALVNAVKNAALADPRFGHMQRRDEIDLRPEGGSGGLLRILGRNIEKDGPLETPLDLDGGLSDLCGVRPLPIALLRRLAAAWRAKERAPGGWLDTMRAEAWTYEIEGSTAGIFRRIVSLAIAAVERYGETDGAEATFRGWVGECARNSPALDAPSPKNKDRRNPLRDDRTLARAWRYAVSNRSRFVPAQLRGSGVPEGQVRVYEGLVAHVRSRGLPPELFAMNYGYLAEVILETGVAAKKMAWKQVRELERRGLIVIHDRGLPLRIDEQGDGRRGLPTFMGLVGQGETPSAVRERVLAMPRLQARLKKRSLDHAALMAPRRRRSQTASRATN